MHCTYNGGRMPFTDISGYPSPRMPSNRALRNDPPPSSVVASANTCWRMVALAMMTSSWLVTPDTAPEPYWMAKG